MDTLQALKKFQIRKVFGDDSKTNRCYNDLPRLQKLCFSAEAPKQKTQKNEGIYCNQSVPHCHFSKSTA